MSDVETWCDAAVVGICYANLLLIFDVLFLLLNFRIAAVIVTQNWYFGVLLPLLESGQLLQLR